MNSGNPYNCPETVWRAMMVSASPMLVDIRKCGPELVQWHPSAPPGYPSHATVTHWRPASSFRHLTLKEIAQLAANKARG
jgi:hypothetical protein